jgi:hypothetical protein
VGKSQDNIGIVEVTTQVSRAGFIATQRQQVIYGCAVRLATEGVLEDLVTR